MYDFYVVQMKKRFTVKHFAFELTTVRLSGLIVQRYRSFDILNIGVLLQKNTFLAYKDNSKIAIKCLSLVIFFV